MGTAYVSNSNGDWGTSTIWTPNGVPSAASGDTVSIGHAVTVTSTQSIGDGTATDVCQITNAAGAKLTITGATLTVRGHLYLNGSNTNLLELALGAGGVIEFDGNSGVTPLLKYYGANKPAILNWQGTSGSHCEIRTKAGTAGNAAYIYQFGGSGSPRVLIDYLNLVRMGQSTIPGLTVQPGREASSSDYLNQYITHVTGTDSSIQVDLNYFAQNCTGKTFTCSDWVMSGTIPTFSIAGNLGVAYIYANNATGFTASAITLARLTFNGAVTIITAKSVASAATITDLVINGQWFYSTQGWTGSVNRAFVAYGMSGAGGVGDFGRNTISNVYWLNTGAGANPHGPVIETNSTITGWIVDCVKTVNASDPGDFFFPQGTTHTHRFHLFLPTASGAQAGQRAFNHIANIGSGNTGITWENNTIAGTGSGAGSGDSGLMGGEINQYVTGGISSLQNNAREGGYSILAFEAAFGSQSDPVSAANADYNFTSLSSTTTQRYSSYVAGSPGTHDVTNQSASWVDSTRNFLTWSRNVRGHNSGNVDTDVAAGIADLVADYSLLASLQTWVRNGWRPRNAAFKTGYNNGTTTDADGNPWPGGTPGIGAMGWTSGTTGAAALLCGL